MREDRFAHYHNDWMDTNPPTRFKYRRTAATPVHLQTLRDRGRERVRRAAFISRRVYAGHVIAVGFCAHDRTVCIGRGTVGRGIYQRTRRAPADFPVDVVAHDWIERQGRRTPAELNLIGGGLRRSGLSGAREGDRDGATSWRAGGPLNRKLINAESIR
jgi:hypothetical protein